MSKHYVKQYFFPYSKNVSIEYLQNRQPKFNKAYSLKILKLEDQMQNNQIQNILQKQDIDLTPEEFINDNYSNPHSTFYVKDSNGIKSEYLMQDKRLEQMSEFAESIQQAYSQSNTTPQFDISETPNFIRLLVFNKTTDDVTHIFIASKDSDSILDEHFFISQVSKGRNPYKKISVSGFSASSIVMDQQVMDQQTSSAQTSVTPNSTTSETMYNEDSFFELTWEQVTEEIDKISNIQ